MQIKKFIFTRTIKCVFFSVSIFLLTGCEPLSEIDKCVIAQVKADKIYYTEEFQKCKKGDNWEGRMYGCDKFIFRKEASEADSRLRCLKAAKSSR